LCWFGYGLRRWRISPPARLTVAFAALTVGCVPLVLATGMPLLIVGLAMSGAAIAPILILGGTLVQRLVDGAVRTQAFSWINSASAAGIAAAAAIAGRVVTARTHAGLRNRPDSRGFCDRGRVPRPWPTT